MNQYKELKKQKKCVVCRIKLLKSYPFVRCDKCIEKQREINKKWYRREIVVDIKKMLREIDVKTV